MTAYYSQYKPVSTVETDTNSPLSVRAINDLADSINNYIRYFAAGKIVSQICMPEWQSESLEGLEKVVAQFTARHVPNIYSQLYWVMGHHIEPSGDGMDHGVNVTWRLYSDRKRYDGPPYINTSYMSKFVRNVSIISESNTHYLDANILNTVFNLEDETHLMLTAQISNSLFYANCSTIDVWPVMV